MTDQPPIAESVSPEQFFEQLLPMGFAAQVQQGQNRPQDLTLQFHLTGDGGGDWAVTISGDTMTACKGSDDANVTVTVSVDDWRDAVLGRGAATAPWPPR
jgi:SOS-response transcriptional repressor LexA